MIIHRIKYTKNVNMQLFSLLQVNMVFLVIVTVCRGYRLPANSSTDNELGIPLVKRESIALRPADIHVNRSMSSAASPETVLNTNWTEIISTEESNQTEEVSDSTQSYSSLTTTSEGVQTLSDRVSGNTLQTKVPQVPSNQSTSTNNAPSNEDGSNTCPLLSFSTTSGFRNERETISCGLTTNPCITSQSHAFNQNHALSIVQKVDEILNNLIYNTKSVLSEILKISGLPANSQLVKKLRNIRFGCFTSKIAAENETSAEVQIQELYKSFVKSYAFLDMTNKAVREIDPTSKIYKEVEKLKIQIYKEVEELKIQIRKIICKIDLLLRNKGNIMNDFPLYVKRKETAIFHPQLGLGLNLYIYVNQIQDFLETVDFVERRYLRSLVF